MTEVRRPGAFYGTNLQGRESAPGRGPERAGFRERTMNFPGAPQRPVEGAVTGPEAPPVEIDHLYNQVDLDQLDPLGRGG